MLVAYDGSAPARRALAHAAEFARPGDSVTVVNVMAEPGVGARIEPPSKERSRQSRLLDEARRFLAEREIEAQTSAPVGDAATEILAAADQVGADLIVVARHRGRAPHTHRSISGRIVRAASCDVLVVHVADAEPGPDVGTNRAWQPTAVERAHRIAYERSGFTVIGIIGVGASPWCGVRTTLDLRQSFDAMASTPADALDRRSVNRDVVLAAG